MKYEIMFIVRPNNEEASVKKVAQSFEKVLKDNGASTVTLKELGQKELAYEINGHKIGYYFLINVESTDVKAINEFDRLASINEEIIRHLIVKEEK